VYSKCSFLPERERNGKRDDSNAVACTGNVEGNKSKPNDDDGVVGESNVLGLIESARTLPRLNGIDCTEPN